MRMLLPIVCSTSLALLACTADDDADDAADATITEGNAESSSESSEDDDDDAADATLTEGDAESGSEPSDDAADDSAGDQIPPTDGATLLPWLEAGSYTGWTAESGPHPSAGPHGSGGVLTFVNDALFASLDAGNGEHPQGAAVVKELFAGDGSISGWAVMVKVEPGQGGASWYWYEIVGTSTYADGVDVGLCTGCHSGGVDQVLTPFPLQ